MYELVLGKIVTVTVDRPLGTYHPEKPGICYPINYGYIEGIMGGDGEYQDAYILGINVPVRQFYGKVIAVIHRLNDNEDKWVVAPIPRTYTKEEILEQVNFREKNYISEIYM